MQRGSKDAVVPKLQRRNLTHTQTLNHGRRLAVAARKIARNLTLSQLDGMLQDVLHIPCLDLLSGLFHTGEFTAPPMGPLSFGTLLMS